MRERLSGWLLGYQQRLATWVRVLAAVSWAGVIWVMSSRTGSGLPVGGWFSYVTNGAHVVVFGVLAGLVLLSTRGSIVSRVRIAIAVTLVYGVIDELHQESVAGRVMDPWDVCSDGMGACVVSFAIWWLLTGDPLPRRMLLPCCVLAGVSVHIAAS